MEWISKMQQYLAAVFQHLNANHATAWSGFYTSIVFAVLLPVLVVLGRRCWGKKDKSEPTVNTFSSNVVHLEEHHHHPEPLPVIPHDPPTPEPCFLHQEVLQDAHRASFIVPIASKNYGLQFSREITSIKQNIIVTILNEPPNRCS